MSDIVERLQEEIVCLRAEKKVALAGWKASAERAALAADKLAEAREWAEGSIAHQPAHQLNEVAFAGVQAWIAAAKSILAILDGDDDASNSDTTPTAAGDLANRELKTTDWGGP